ncbi:hypothetical protein D3C85_580900 [compost metagenome]
MRCKSCNVPLLGKVKYKDHEHTNGILIEEDFCSQCSYETSVLDYVDVHTYQFEDITENPLYGFILEDNY